ncbi:MAG: DUF4405 domain-containing protein [Patescibacteria group bacterium]|jgi:hypothetical protein
MLITKIRAVLSTALALSFIGIVASSLGLEFGSFQAWGEPHRIIGWTFIALAALHLILNAKMYLTEIRASFRKKT